MMQANVLGWLDYAIFAITLGSFACIGIYFGYFTKKQQSANEYLYGNGQVKALPIAMSLYSSAVNGVVILGAPAEIYVFGSQYIMMFSGFILALFGTWYLVIPVFCGNLKFKSPYEYLELRFNYTVRLASSIMYFVHTLLFMPIMLYTGTLAFSEATGAPLEFCVLLVGGVCVFYTTAGGFLTVVWTDTLQAVLIFCSCLFILYRGASEVGGMAEVWRRAEQGKRIILFNMDPNPFERLTFWSISLGMGVWFIGHGGCTAGALQRYMALPNERLARIGCLINVVCVSCTVFGCCLIGLCIFALFYDCDPVASKKIKGYNQLVPYYVSQIVETVPGFYGFFNAGLLSAALSTISAEMNTVGGLLYYDIIKKIWKTSLTPSREALVIKVLVFVNGVYYLITAPQIHKIKYLTQVANTISGVTYGVKVGVMLLGTTFPKCNSKGVICGMIAAIAVVTWISIGNLYYDVAAAYVLPMSTNCSSFLNYASINNTVTCIGSNDRCLSDSNATLATPLISPGEVLFVYKLSFMYYPVLGLIITILVGLLVSYLTTPNDVNKMDPYLMIPCRRPGIKADSVPSEA